MDIWKGIVLGIGLWISCSFANFVQAQVKPASIFEIGKEISCCEDNFYNLFRNWDKRNIRNADSIRLLSYEYVGIVDNRAMVRMYADLMSSWDYPLAGGSAG